MGRKRSQTPKMYEHKGTGYWCVNVEGRRVYLGKEKDKATAEYKRVLLGLLAGNMPRKSERAATVGEVIEAYVGWAAKRYVKRGKQTQQLDRIRGACDVLAELHMLTAAEAFDEFALEEVQQAMAARGWKRREVNARVTCLKAMFKWASKRRLVPAAVAGALLVVDGLRKGSGVAPESEPVKPVSAAVVRRVLPFCGPALAAMIRLQWITGMRPIEVTHLRGCDIEKRGGIWVYTVPDEWNKLAHLGIARVIPLGPRCQKLLRVFLTRDPAAYLFSPAEDFAWYQARKRESRKTPLYPSHLARYERERKGRRFAACYDSRSYQHAITYAVKRARKASHPPMVYPERFAPNRLRHAAACNIRRHHGLDAAQVLLGHSSRVTTERYAKADAARLHQLMKKIG